ncbi:hypothetical protein [Coralloluteibacterium stylophorae]|uniref:Uncharacterized protein n=1 Tax=Coralloluteibacterium stylophorae TaxID=1776034 RepID=A0A8J7VRK0_9GAMM|nr:hypothetical protein [Coralloluteibacterium stylophorae]MBS7457088.1 hypothetical protein [Coralloluteibacterium stylophorae]
MAYPAFDPLRAEARALCHAWWARWHRDRAGLLVELLAWMLCAVGAGIVLHGFAPTMRNILSWLPSHALVAVVGTATLVWWQADARSRRRLAATGEGWLAALPQTADRVPAALWRAACRDAGTWSGAWLALVCMAAAQRDLEGPEWDAAFTLGAVLLLVPPLAARHVLRSRPRDGGAAPRAPWSTVGRALPPAMAWQLARARGAWRGRGLAFRLAPVLLLVPAGMAGLPQLAALAGLLVAAGLLSLWSEALRTMLAAAELMRAQPLGPAQRPLP